MYRNVESGQGLLYDKRNPLAPQEVGTPVISTEWTIDAVVVDVIVNEEHPDFAKDGYNIGCVKFRSMKTHFYRPNDQLHWAFPLDSTIEEFPLKNEIVRIFQALNRFYYTRKLDLGNRPSQQAMFGLENEMGPVQTGTQKTDDFRKSTYAPKNETFQTRNELGNYFKDLESVYKLRHWEGDVIFEGRSGQSIRMGTSWTNPSIHKGFAHALQTDQSPNILIRIGPDKQAVRNPDTGYGRVVEDINKDATSVWLVTDQVVPLIPSTKSSKVHHKSVTNFPEKYTGNQIIINTDRFVVNTKQERVFIYSGRGYHVTTLGDASLDVDKNFISVVGGDSKIEILQNVIHNTNKEHILWIGKDSTHNIVGEHNSYIGKNIRLHAGTKICLVSPKIYIGSESSNSEPMVLGAELVKILDAIISAHLSAAGAHVITPVGPGSLSPKVVSELTRIKGKLRDILSNDNYVSKKNESPKSPNEKIDIHSE